MKKTIGVVGGGQLCLMMGEAIQEHSLPYNLVAVDPTQKCPAYRVLDKQLVGDYKDAEKIRELGALSDILTFEIELANGEVLAELQSKGTQVHPSPGTLQIIQDKYTQAEYLKKSGLPVPHFEAVETAQDLERCVQSFGLPLMIKARRDSYDGRGNFVLREKKQVKEVLDYFQGKEIMAQQYIPFDVEVSVMSARSSRGEVKTFPVGENIHGKDYNILLTTIVPARISPSIEQKARKVASDTMDALAGAGVFGIEMLVQNDQVYINEIAPRVHNSGHYTIEACKTSQFEQHLRAVSGDSLGDTDLVTPFAVMHNIIGPQGYTGPYDLMFGRNLIEGTVQIDDGIFIHNYGKHVTKPNRKMGHLTVTAVANEDLDEVMRWASDINFHLKIVPRS